MENTLTSPRLCRIDLSDIFLTNTSTDAEEEKLKNKQLGNWKQKSF